MNKPVSLLFPIPLSCAAPPYGGPLALGVPAVTKTELDQAIRTHLGKRPWPPAKYTESQPHCITTGRTRCPSYADCLLCKCAINPDDPDYQNRLWKYNLRVHRWNNRFRHDERIPYATIVAVYFRCDGCCEYEQCEYPNGTLPRDIHHLTYKRAYGFERPEDLMLMCRYCHKDWHRIHGTPS